MTHTLYTIHDLPDKLGAWNRKVVMLSLPVCFICAIAIACLVLLLKAVFAKLSHCSHYKGNASGFQALYGWVEFIAHGMSFARIRDNNAHNIIQLTFGSSRHHFLYDPAHIQAFAELRTAAVDFTKIKWKMFNNTFGVPAKYQDGYEKASIDMDACVHQHLLQDQYMSDMARTATRNIARCVERLVTNPKVNEVGEVWERHTSRRLVRSNAIDGSGAANEVDLFPLLTNFLEHMTVPAMMGHAFLARSPGFLDDIECLDESFILMTLGFPRWLPIPGLKRAYEARDRLHKCLARQYLLLDQMAEGSKTAPVDEDLSDVSRLFISFDTLWKRIGLSTDERAAAGLGLPWALTINANNLFFWLILRICATPGLLENIRTEIEGNFESLERGKDLGRACPLLKACYFETARLSGDVRSIRRAKREMTIPVGDPATSQAVHRFLPGDYIHALHYLHHFDPKYYPEPREFRPERFLSKKGTPGINQGTLRPYGAGFSACKGKIVAERVVLYAAAAVFLHWDIKPADTVKGWKIPGQLTSAGVCKPNGNVRVILSRRT